MLTQATLRHIEPLVQRDDEKASEAKEEGDDDGADLEVRDVHGGCQWFPMVATCVLHYIGDVIILECLFTYILYMSLLNSGAIVRAGREINPTHDRRSATGMECLYMSLSNSKSRAGNQIQTPQCTNGQVVCVWACICMVRQRIRTVAAWVARALGRGQGVYNVCVCVHVRDHP